MKIIDTTPKTTEWVTASDTNGSCVEMRRVGTDVEIRDTKNREAGVQTYSLIEIDALLRGAKNGVFDHIVY
jgi:hypothetical protein